MCSQRLHQILYLSSFVHDLYFGCHTAIETNAGQIRIQIQIRIYHFCQIRWS